jgi:hypothetical protein
MQFQDFSIMKIIYKKSSENNLILSKKDQAMLFTRLTTYILARASNVIYCYRIY